MSHNYIDFARIKLQNRVKRLASANPKSFHTVLQQTWDFLQSNEITKGILDDLERRCATLEGQAERVLRGQGEGSMSENDYLGICLWVTKKCVLSPTRWSEFEIGRFLTTKSEAEDVINAFRIEYIAPLLTYVDEQIDESRVILALLRRYKHRCEWFRGPDLLSKCESNTRQGEGFLAVDLYEYLYDQGVQFHIEPRSASGRIDLVSWQIGADRLVADVKLFNPNRGQDCRYLIKGFRQIYDYVRDYNETVGYLIIFKTCAEDLSIPTALQQTATPFVTHNNKSIFFVIIDIWQYAQSASKRSKVKSYEITPKELVEFIALAEARGSPEATN